MYKYFFIIVNFKITNYNLISLKPIKLWLVRKLLFTCTRKSCFYFKFKKKWKMVLRSQIKQICKGHGFTWQKQGTEVENFMGMSNDKFRDKC